jgi:hypothetical protein
MTSRPQARALAIRPFGKCKRLTSFKPADRSFLINLGHGRVYGNIHGNTVDFFWQDSVLICTATLTGTGTIAGGLITGSVSGQMSDGY